MVFKQEVGGVVERLWEIALAKAMVGQYPAEVHVLQLVVGIACIAVNPTHKMT